MAAAQNPTTNAGENLSPQVEGHKFPMNESRVPTFKDSGFDSAPSMTSGIPEHSQKDCVEPSQKSLSGDDGMRGNTTKAESATWPTEHSAEGESPKNGEESNTSPLWSSKNEAYKPSGGFGEFPGSGPWPPHMHPGMPPFPYSEMGPGFHRNVPYYPWYDPFFFCADDEDEVVKDIVLPKQLAQVPMKALQLNTKEYIANKLDPDTDDKNEDYTKKNWEGLAEYMKLDPQVIAYIAAHRESKTMCVLEKWNRDGSRTIGELWDLIKKLNRIDVLEYERVNTKTRTDATMYLKKQQHVQAHQPPKWLRRFRQRRNSDSDNEDSGNGILLDPEEAMRIRRQADVSEDDLVIVQDVGRNPSDYITFDAYVSYCDKNLIFVREVIKFLEEKHKLKLCIKERDLLPGSCNYYDVASIIAKRCRKMIVLMSPDYLRSNECDYQSKVALSLNRTQILVMYEQCDVPPAISFMCLLRYNDMPAEWFWRRMHKAVLDTKTDIFDTCSYGCKSHSGVLAQKITQSKKLQKMPKSLSDILQCVGIRKKESNETDQENDSVQNLLQQNAECSCLSTNSTCPKAADETCQASAGSCTASSRKQSDADGTCFIPSVRSSSTSGATPQQPKTDHPGLPSNPGRPRQPVYLWQPNQSTHPGHPNVITHPGKSGQPDNYTQHRMNPGIPPMFDEAHKEFFYRKRNPRFEPQPIRLDFPGARFMMPEEHMDASGNYRGPYAFYTPYQSHTKHHACCIAKKMEELEKQAQKSNQVQAAHSNSHVPAGNSNRDLQPNDPNPGQVQTCTHQPKEEALTKTVPSEPRTEAREALNESTESPREQEVEQLLPTASLQRTGSKDSGIASNGLSSEQITEKAKEQQDWFRNVEKQRLNEITGHDLQAFRHHQMQIENKPYQQLATTAV